jgi:hypothetical protein
MMKIYMQIKMHLSTRKKCEKSDDSCVWQLTLWESHSCLMKIYMKIKLLLSTRQKSDKSDCCVWQLTLWRSRSCLMKVDLPASAAPIRRMSISSASTNRVSWDEHCKLHVFLQRVFVWRALRFVAVTLFLSFPSLLLYLHRQAASATQREERGREGKGRSHTGPGEGCRTPNKHDTTKLCAS